MAAEAAANAVFLYSRMSSRGVAVRRACTTNNTIRTMPISSGANQPTSWADAASASP